MTRWGKKTKISAIMVIILGIVGGISIGAAAIVSATARAKPMYYVALGDSVAAGAGLPPATGSPDDAPCGRSSISYPVLLASEFHAHLTNLSCSGATISNGILGSQIVTSSNVTIPPQLERAFQNGVPDVMTITIGANDAHWVDFVSKCYVATCGGLQDTAAAAGYLTYLQGQLAYVLHQIKDRSGSHAPPRVYLTGYYYPVSSTSCLGGTVTNSELSWINAQTDNLNKAIRQTVAATTKISSWFKGTYNFATYVPISFSGHGLCSSVPWVQGPSDNAPLHPNTIGAAQIASALYAQIK